jgi:hypothetical protein
VLAAVITLTVGLSVASRVITNTKTTTDEVNTQKALSAAETGIEQSLKSQAQVGSVNSPKQFSNNSSFYTKYTPVAYTQFVLNGGNTVSQDDGADIWLSDHGATTTPSYAFPRTLTMKIYWTDSGSDCSKNQKPAIELVYLTGSAASPSLTRKVYDPCARITGTLDSTGPGTTNPIQGINFQHSASLDINNGLIARVIPLYTGTRVAVEFLNQGTVNPYSPSTPPGIPSQGVLVESTGTSANVTRTLRVFQGYPKLPAELFPYTLFIP